MSRAGCYRLAALAALWTAASPGLGVADDDAGGRKYAVLVGVSEYQARAELRALPGAENDITRLREVLIDGGYRPADVTVLSCRGATRPTGANIRAAIADAVARCQPEDTLVLAFAGHGIQFHGSPEPFFCPHDAVWNATDTLIPLLTVFAEVGRCPAKRKLLLVDACRNDPLAESAAQGEHKKALAQGFSLALPAAGDFVALLSCDKGQTSWEDSRLRHGVFFHHVILGLAGEAAAKDGTVTLDGLVNYVRQGVRDHVKKEFDADQVPYQLGQAGLFPLVQPAAATEVQRLMREALVAAGKGDAAAARLVYDRVVALDKKHADAYYQRGLLAKSEARELKNDPAKAAVKFGEAARDFDKALRYKPDLVAAYVARADANYWQESLQAALRDYETALELDEQAAELLTERGHIYFWLENRTKAVADATAALALNPDYARAYYVRGISRLAADDADGLADLDRAVTIDPLNVVYRDYRLKVLATRGDAARLEKEAARLEQVARYVPRSDLPAQQIVITQQTTVGDFYHARGDAARSTRVFQQASSRADWVGGGLTQPGMRNDWANRVNTVQNRAFVNAMVGGIVNAAVQGGKPSGGLFGPRVQQGNGGLFGNNQPNRPAGGNTGGLFGNNLQGNRPVGGNNGLGGIFGNNNQQANRPIGGNTGGIFGNNSQSQGRPIGGSNGLGNIFGGGGQMGNRPAGGMGGMGGGFGGGMGGGGFGGGGRPAGGMGGGGVRGGR